MTERALTEQPDSVEERAQQLSSMVDNIPRAKNSTLVTTVQAWLEEMAQENLSEALAEVMEHLLAELSHRLNEQVMPSAVSSGTYEEIVSKRISELNTVPMEELASMYVESIRNAFMDRQVPPVFIRYLKDMGSEIMARLSRISE